MATISSKTTMQKAKVLIAIPNLGSIHPLLVMRLLQWATMPTEGVEEVSYFMPTGRIPHDNARNFCVLHFLKTDFTHLFFIDNDVVPPPDALAKLVAADKPVVSGLYNHMRAEDGEEEPVKRWCVFVYGERPNNGWGLIPVQQGAGLVPIKRAGGGCLMIKREVIEKVGAPWFRFQYHEYGLMHYGEDIDFCAKAEKAGFEIFAHFDVKCKHLKEIFI